MSRRGDSVLPYLHRSSRRRSRTPTRGIHTRAQSTLLAHSLGRCRLHSRTGPGRGTERPLGAAQEPGTDAPTLPGTACMWHLTRFCMGRQTTAGPQSGTDTVPSALSPRFLPDGDTESLRPHISLGANVPLEILS